MNNNETFMITNSYLDEEYKAEYVYQNETYNEEFLEDINSVVDGYMIKPVALYNGVPVAAKTRLAKNLEDIKNEFIKEKESEKKIFFYKLAFYEGTQEYYVRYAVL